MANLRVVNAALDEEQEIILRGKIDPDTFDQIRVDDYQREILPQAKISGLMKALTSGDVPDILLNMRGDRLKGNDKDGYALMDPVYVYDGQQRLTAAKKLWANGVKCRLGCKVYFGHDRDWERQQFIILNSTATRVHANVIMRGLTEEYPAIEALYNLCNDSTFAMKGKICWTQYMKRDQLLGANAFLATVITLHKHVYGTEKRSALIVAKSIQKVYDRIGRNTLRNNVKHFYAAHDEMWGIQNVTFKNKASHLKWGWLGSIAQVLSDYREFWRGDSLLISAPVKRKLKTFPLTDPAVQDMCSQGRVINITLKRLIIDHLNKSRKTNRLVNRYDLNGAVIQEEPKETDGDDE